MRVEVLGGVERRRRWSLDDKMRIVEETLAPGAKVTEVARRNGVAASVVFTWRRQARTVEKAGVCFTPVRRSFCPRMTGECGRCRPPGQD
jgi:transposase